MTLLPIPIRGESSLAATLTRETNRINNSDFHGFGCTCVELHQSPVTGGSKQDQGPRSQTSDKTFFNFCFAKTDFRTNWPTFHVVQTENIRLWPGAKPPDPWPGAMFLDPAGTLSPDHRYRLAFRVHHVAPNSAPESASWRSMTQRSSMSL